MNKLSRSLALLCAVVAFQWFNPVDWNNYVFASTIFAYQIDGQNNQVIHNDSTAEFTLLENHSGGASFALACNNGFDWWRLEFSPSFGNSLEVGHYDNTVSFGSDPSLPILNVKGRVYSGEGYGYFDVLEVAYDVYGGLQSFAADFHQGDSQYGIYGSICHNSDLECSMSPAPVPEPATMLLFGSGVLGLTAMRRRKKY